MSLEEILEQAAHARPGYELVTFKEAGLPVYVLTLRILTLERKALGPIDEAILRAVQAGLNSPQDVVAFLGLSTKVLNPVLAGLNTTELINYSCAVREEGAKVTLTAKGRLTLAELATTKPQERTVRICFDALTRKLLFVSPEQLYKPREMRDYGYFEVPAGNAKRPEVEDIPIQDFDRVLQQQRAGVEAKVELLGIRRVEKRELLYMNCVMLFYRSTTQRTDIDVAFWREDGPALEHETCFRTLGGPELVGSKVLAAQSTNDVTVAIDLAGSNPANDRTSLTSPEGEKLSEPLNVNGTSPSPQEDTLKSILCHEHPGFLKKALLSSKKRLLIISPWIRHQVVNWEFIASLEALLRNGVDVYIGYGIDDGEAGAKGNAAQSKIAITPQAERDLGQLSKKYPNFRLTYVGNTHRKSLVSDDSFAVTTSFNWLSFKGDPRDKPRDERGVVILKKRYVDQQFDEDLSLLEKGYSGPSSRISGNASGSRNDHQ
ncbi:MAG: hypothetical protein KIT42_05185 [Rhodocyclaceae bacterium]|nr:hypothetical protein [Rhodocyclaceae bacterium]